MKLAAPTLLAMLALTALASCSDERDEFTQATSAGSRAGRTGNAPPYPDAITSQGRGILGTGGFGRSGDPQIYNDRGVSGFTLVPVTPDAQPPLH